MVRNPLPLILAAFAFAPLAAAQAPQPEAGRASGFMLADVDGDGRVTPDELRVLLNARFSALDSDSDGLVAIADLGRGGNADGRGPGGSQPPGGRHRPPPPDGNFRGPPPGGPPPGGPPPGDRRGPPPGGTGELAGNFPFPHPEDSNEDGFISRAEFLRPAAAMFDAWDRNHDGGVTADERPESPTPSQSPQRRSLSMTLRPLSLVLLASATLALAPTAPAQTKAPPAKEEPLKAGTQQAQKPRTQPAAKKQPASRSDGRYGTWNSSWGAKPPAPPAHFTKHSDWYRHVRACQGKYRSYNARTDSYRSYGGRTLRCRL